MARLASGPVPEVMYGAPLAASSTLEEVKPVQQVDDAVPGIWLGASRLGAVESRVG